MAKAKNKSSANSLMESISKQSIPKLKDASSNSPTESSFAGLRQKVEVQLQKAPKYQKRKIKSIKSKSAKKDKEAIGASVPKIQDEMRPKGKKRDHNGDILNGLVKGDLKKPSETDDSTRALDRDALEVEISALGGTTEDLDLINGADSDSEMEGTSKQDAKGLDKGIQNILREIALSQNQIKDTDGGLSDVSEESEAEGVLEDVGERLTDTKKHTQLPTNVKVGTKSSRIISGLHCELRPDWFNAAYLDIKSSKPPQYTLSSIALEQLQRHAKSILDAENESFNRTQQSSSQSFYNTVIASGTLSDKISALTLAVQESPVHNVKALETLIGLAKKRSRAQAVDVLRALKDLFAQGSLLPSSRKLYSFQTQPGLIAGFSKTRTWKIGEELPRGVTQSQLASWSFENWLKEQYFEILKTLEVWCNDEIEYSKSRAVNYVFELLKEKPEQEANLLRLLINKLGDPLKKIASQTSYLLMQLLAVHPAMKMTVLSAIESDFLFRPGQSMHGKYYAIVTLNQTTLSSQEQAVAAKLLDIYFSLFGALLKPTDTKKMLQLDGPSKSITRGERRNKKNKGKDAAGAGRNEDAELREKFVAAILTGVNRAYPYSDAEGQNLFTHLETLFKITHSSNFNTSIQAMMLIQQLSASHQALADRFYRTLYESLLDARLASSSKQQLYLNLLHRALTADLNLKRVKAFMKRLLQILTLHEPSFICAAFFLLKDLETTFPALNGLMDQAEDHDPEEESFRDVEEDDSNLGNNQVRRQPVEASKQVDGYNGRKRDPEHSHADNSCAWELLPFLAHYHPSVSVNAGNFLQHMKMLGKPDVNLHTMVHFLDRFVYKNPKQASSSLRGSSIMQPMASNDPRAVLISSKTVLPSLPVNTDGFRTQKDDQVAAEDVFFHKYFSGLGKDSVKQKVKKSRANDDDSSFGEDGEEEDEVWKAMTDSAPDLEGVDDSDEGLEMSDLESNFEEKLDDMSDDEEEVDSEEEESEGEGGGVHVFGDSEDEMVDFDDEEGLGEGATVEVSRISGPAGNSKNAEAREKRKKMKGLPVFASASDYAAMLDDDEDEDMGM